MTAATAAPAIAGADIAKKFGHVQALQDASISVKKGEVVALFGDNGAGKSTLLRILLGIYQPDTGKISVDGAAVHFRSIRDAQNLGIECVHQDLALAPDLSVADNIFLGHEIETRGIGRLFGILNRREMERLVAARLAELSISLPSFRLPVRDLSGGQRQAAAVARAVMWATSAVLLDEPTAALGARQSDIVCDVMRAIADAGLGVLVVSHDLPRVLKAADRVVILVRGATVLDAPARDLSVPDIVSTMVGYGLPSADAAG